MEIGAKVPGTRLMTMKDDWSDLVDGAYYKLPDGSWAVCPPGGVYGTLSPTVHQIVEHEDGTITVTPSILYHPWADGSHGWHGYLRAGIWGRV